MLPFEFVVQGTPISQQAKGSSRRRWMNQVLSAAQQKWPANDDAVECELKMTVVYYYEGAALDTDNMLKPIQDALEGLVYVDDSQVTDITAGKRKLDGSFKIRGLSPELAEGFISDDEFVHIKIEEAPDPQELV